LRGSRRRARHQLQDRGFRQDPEGQLRRCRPDPRHGGGTLSGEEPRRAAHRGAAGHHRRAGWRQGGSVHPDADDEAADRHRLDAAAAQRHAEGADRARPLPRGLAAAGGAHGAAADPRDDEAGGCREGARPHGIQHPYRKDHARNLRIGTRQSRRKRRPQGRSHDRNSYPFGLTHSVEIGYFQPHTASGGLLNGRQSGGIMAELLMPKATAVSLVENTALSFEQIADFCGLHPLEVQAIADGEVATGMQGLDPVANGQLSWAEIERCTKDTKARLAPAIRTVEVPAQKRKGPKYTPISKRQDKPDAIAYLLRYHPELSDAQIGKLLGTTKPTIQAVRDKSHWNSSSIRA